MLSEATEWGGLILLGTLSIWLHSSILVTQVGTEPVQHHQNTAGFFLPGLLPAEAFLLTGTIFLGERALHNVVVLAPKIGLS